MTETPEPTPREPTPAERAAAERAERTTRHIRLCQRMSDLSVQLAEGAARIAAAQQALEERALLDATPDTPERPSRSQATAASFNRLCANARQCITLEARLAAGYYENAAGKKALKPPPDTRRSPLRRLFGCQLEENPDRRALREEALERLDEEIANDPAHSKGIEDLFYSICQELGIDTDLKKMPDDVLDLLAGPWTEADIAERDKSLADKEARIAWRKANPLPIS